jgi:hypothetical protein
MSRPVFFDMLQKIYEWVRTMMDQNLSTLCDRLIHRVRREEQGHEQIVDGNGFLSTGDP